MKSAVNSRGSIYSETEGSICLKCPSWSGATITSGSNNVCIGYVADASATLTNAISIGSSCTVTASNSVMFGNSLVTKWGFGKNVAGANVIENVVNTALLTNAGVWTNASDSTFKTHIKNINYGLNDVLKLRPVSYDMKKNGNHDIGFLAQEVKLIIPEIVYGEEGQMSLSYGQLTSVLTKAIQEQQQMIDSLKAEVLGLKFLVLGLKAENKTLKSDYDNRLKKIEELLGTKAER
jgi:hypothetical protein